MVPQQRRGFSPVPFFESVNNRLMRFHYVGQIFGNSWIRRTHPQVDRQRVPHAQHDFVLRGFQDDFVELHIVFGVCLQITVADGYSHRIQFIL